MVLHPRLDNDCIQFFPLQTGHLLLHKNALVPWFILVPDTKEPELFKLSDTQQSLIQQELNLIAGFIESHFKTDKLNIATIGNIVPQLHIHVIGRWKDDFCWPEPVWGQSMSDTYSNDSIEGILTAFKQYIAKAHQQA